MFFKINTNEALPLKLSFILTIVFITFYMCFILNTSVDHSYRRTLFPSITNFRSVHREWKKLPQRCPAPLKLNYNDSFVSGYLKNETFQCKTIPSMTEVSESGLITMTSSKPANVSCYYSLLWRKRGWDNYIDYRAKELIPTNGVQLTEYNQMSNVSCVNDLNETIYKNTHLFIPKYRQLNMNGKNHTYRPSVLIFIIESLSNLSFKRFMVETQSALDSLGHVTQFENFVKPMDNSFPNAIALLTGQRADYSRERRFKKDYFDNTLPFIWQDFDKSGYATGLLEDLCRIGVFNYGKFGFREPPVDWYEIESS